MKRKNDKPSIWRDAAEILAVILVFALLMWMFVTMVRIVFDYVRERRDVNELKADTVNPEDGVGRVTAFVSVVSRSMAEAPAGEENTALWAYVEGEGTPPEWWNPDEPMAVEWYAEEVEVEPHPPVGISTNGIDWNICSTLYGSNGLKMEKWEMGLFARILYREFWGTSRECCEAGADSIINLWASGYYGNSLFDTLSAVTETGGYAFSTYPGVWEYDYDPDGLAEMQAICEERFYNGTEYAVQFFRTCRYHDWCEPCFSIDNVYFGYSPLLDYGGKQ